MFIYMADVHCVYVVLRVCVCVCYIVVVCSVCMYVCGGVCIL